MPRNPFLRYNRSKLFFVLIKSAMKPKADAIRAYEDILRTDPGNVPYRDMPRKGSRSCWSHPHGIRSCVALTQKVHFAERTAGTYASKPLERRMCVWRVSKRRG